jgi:DNA (cytosine-5)-methyltransferase 1
MLSHSEPDFTSIDLFAGIGGFRLPLQNIGGKCVFTSEFNKKAQQTYLANYGEVPHGDITKIDLSIIPNHDILTAGFPCQPFSLSGKMWGFEDTRGTLIYSVFKIIELKQPKVVLLENVKQLLHHDKGNTLKVIIDSLNELGYLVSYKVLDASSFGVPQSRERIILVAHKDKMFDFSNLHLKERPKLRDFLDKDGNFDYLSDSYTLLDSSITKIQPSGLIFAGYRDKEIRKVGVKPNSKHLSRAHKQPNRIYSSEGVHPTISSQELSGRYFILHEGRVRKLSLNECYRIMGFPDSFIKIESKTEAYRQIGNSVCIPMIQEIGCEIKRQLLSL